MISKIQFPFVLEKFGRKKEKGKIRNILALFLNITVAMCLNLALLLSLSSFVSVF